MGLGAAALITSQKKEVSGTPGPPFDLSSADNGLSVNPIGGKIELGQGTKNSAGPAILLGDRHIPMDGNSLIFDSASFPTGAINIRDNLRIEFAGPFKSTLVGLHIENTTDVTEFFVVGTQDTLGNPSAQLLFFNPAGNFSSINFNSDASLQLVFGSTQKGNIVGIPSGFVQMYNNGVTAADSGDMLQVFDSAFFDAIPSTAKAVVFVRNSNAGSSFALHAQADFDPIVVSSLNAGGFPDIQFFAGDPFGAGTFLGSIGAGITENNLFIDVRNGGFISLRTNGSPRVFVFNSGNTQIDPSSSGHADAGRALQVYGEIFIDAIAGAGSAGTRTIGWDTLAKIICTKGVNSSAVFSGTGVAVTFVIPHSLGVVPGIVKVSPTSAASASPFYISAKTSSTFSITYLVAPVAGVNNGTIDFEVTSP